MKLLLFGRNGQLGRELERCLAVLGELTAWDVDDLNMLQDSQLTERIHAVQPQVIVNAAAFTAVDHAEQQADLAFRLNGHAPGVIAQCARSIRALFIHYSTDYVFDGEKDRPYTEADPPKPLNAYGRSKLAGERAVEQAGGTHLVLRTSWLYSLDQASFVGRVLAWSRKLETMRIVTDQVGSPTWARMLAEATLQILEQGGADPFESLRPRRGLYHLAGRGAASRYDLAASILAMDPHPEQQVCRRIERALSAEFPAPARRPSFSALDCSRIEAAFQLELPPWQVSLQAALRQAG